MADPSGPEADRLSEQIANLETANWAAEAALASEINITAENSAVIDLSGRLRRVNVTALHAATVRLAVTDDNTERVQLTGSLPRGAALEPGCTDVWTIRLGTQRSPFFIPAKYHLQLTVIYGFEPQKVAFHSTSEEISEPEDPPRRRIFSNTTALTVPVKSALWNVMLGGIIGGTVGSAGRSLQNARTVDHLIEGQLGVAAASLILSTILSWAAIIFSARKSEAQSFVTVEDFWGGLLIGFLIGYSGTAAFTSITGVKT
ncbi:hypothetical protein [Streptacidiphilus jiangxiensis]|uniref:Uncharacterized protein n=1 Tax=Streptacidiphilus jiangxiensis TaxID=235985 RepID=A0A1H7NEQ7_STRJI|nr:hypothetical protein [Streptacidiphilus jiangxiensis]SEL21801.1 hypothetical protein SAMN05414137_106341 [Streptacidiphilus jiangxiensis]